jgi:hypothetical protein
MKHTLTPNGCATLVGSQPLSDHKQATGLVLAYTPDIPTWVQLPVYPHEGMVAQFMTGLPGLRQDGDRYYADDRSDQFDEQMLDFFQTYLSISETGEDWSESRFALTLQTAPGFFALLEALSGNDAPPLALKGQVTGPITFCTAMKDQQGRAIFYHDSLRDAAVKMIALKAAWQVRQLKRFGRPVMLSIDEPALAGYGSSELISISREDIGGCLQEVIDAVHQQDGLAGVHVCANTDWSLLLNSDVDVINFDAFGYFEKFMLYAEQIKAYLQSGRLLAIGLVPTANADQVRAATLESLWSNWVDIVGRMERLGIGADTLRAQSIITPSCGTGSLTPELSEHVLILTRALSERVRGVR